MKVKLCPFCEEESRICWSGDGLIVFVECYGCKASGPKIYAKKESTEPSNDIQKRAIKKWNKLANRMEYLIKKDNRGRKNERTE